MTNNERGKLHITTFQEAFFRMRREDGLSYKEIADDFNNQGAYLDTQWTPEEVKRLYILERDRNARMDV